MLSVCAKFPCSTNYWLMSCTVQINIIIISSTEFYGAQQTPQGDQIKETKNEDKEWELPSEFEGAISWLVITAKY